MPYIIDGHNLIGSIPGINLSDPDDEQQLIGQLLTYFARIGKQATLYFDRRAPGEEKERRLGNLHIRFITLPQTADDAIRKHLHNLRGRARNYTVVSSDHQIQQAARLSGARVLDSQRFVRLLFSRQTAPDEDEKTEKILSELEIQHWEMLFKKSDPRNE